MRYRLRTLLIALAVGPPLLARPIAWLWEHPAVFLGLVFAAIFAIFWVSCGIIWLKVVQLFVHFSEVPRN